MSFLDIVKSIAVIPLIVGGAIAMMFLSYLIVPMTIIAAGLGLSLFARKTANGFSKPKKKKKKRRKVKF